MDCHMKFSLNVKADYACFSDPISKVGGERLCYPVPTYDALKGVVQAVYWKPTLVCYIDRVRILAPIKMETKGMLYPRYDEGLHGDRAYATYLKDVNYNIDAHFEWDMTRPDLARDRIPEKHLSMMERAIERGGRRAPFLGKRDAGCYAEVSRIKDIMEGEGCYDYIPEVNFGTMVHGISYADKNYEPVTSLNDVKQPAGKQFVRLWDVVMRNGIIEFPRPNEMKQFFVRDVQLNQKGYSLGKNICSVEEEAEKFGLD